jgi:MFS family permease
MRIHSMISTCKVRGLPDTFWYLFAGTFVNRLGGFVVPFLALYLTGERGYSLREVGLATALYGAGSLAAGPVGGWLADRFGRRPTMIGALLSSACAMVQLGLARHPVHLAAATVILGFVGELYRPAMQAAVSDLVPTEDRVRAYGYIYWAVNLGFAAAAALAGLLVKLGYLTLFLADAATTFCFALIVVFKVPETRPAAAEHRVSTGGPFTALGDQVLVGFLLIQLIVGTIFYQSNVALPVDMREHGTPASQYGLLLTINGVLIVLLQPLAVRFVPRQSRTLMLSLGALLVGSGFGMTGLGSGASFYALTIVVWTLGEIVLSPVASAVVADMAPPELRGRYQGAFQMCYGLSSLAGPLIGSAVMSHWDAGSLWLGCFAGGLLAVALQLALHPALMRRLRVADPR